MVLPYCNFVLTDLIAKVTSHKKAISKGADCSCINVNCQLRHDLKSQTGFREGIILSYDV